MVIFLRLEMVGCLFAVLSIAVLSYVLFLVTWFPFKEFFLKSFAITYWILLQGCADSRREVRWLGCFTRHPGLPCVQPVRM